MSDDSTEEMDLRLRVDHVRWLKTLLSPQGLGTNDPFFTRITEALAAHDAARNPLCTPWEAEANPHHGWSVRDSEQHVLAAMLTEAQARLMAAAPELADALGKLVAERHQCNEDALSCCECEGVSALRKAGRR